MLVCGFGIFTIFIFLYFVSFLTEITQLTLLDSILKSSDSAPDSSEFPLFSHPCLKSFFPTITGLAEVHNVHGELLILEAVLSWLPRCKDIVLTVIKNKLDHNCDAFMLQFGNACGFLSDLLEQIKLISSVVSILKIYTIYLVLFNSSRFAGLRAARLGRHLLHALSPHQALSIYNNSWTR